MERTEYLKYNNPMQNLEILKRMLDTRKKIKTEKDNKILETTLSTLPEEIKQILWGTIIADGHLQLNKVNAILRLAHSKAQSEYLFWKANKISSFFGNYKIYEYKDKNLICVTFKAHPYFTYLYNKIYKSGKRHIPQEIINKLDSLGISILYFDDGHRYGRDQRYFISRKSKQDRYKISNLLNKKRIKNNVYPNGIYITAEGGAIFKKMVYPNLHTKDMEYKII